MKFFIVFFFITSFFFSNINVSAQTNIVFLDLDRIVNESLAGKNMISELENLHKKKIIDFKKTEEKLKNEETKIVSKKNLLSKEEYQKEIKLLRGKVKKYRTQRKNSTDSLTQKRLAGNKKLLQLINPILQNFSTTNSIDIIIHKRAIILGKSNKDITKEILDLVNKTIKKINLD